ncbi:MAG: glycine zipper 2TM domain-containing protein [Phenylobacterium sp.]|uniref:glycine zipper 2TM domain-containing protein n=1 Tax=Phenylobacterium sp. TaxID=1871053 RepID=UPI003BB7D9B0
MRKTLLAAGIAAAALLPTFALAQQTCEQQQQNNRVAGTVIGAGLGAILGSQVSGNGARTEGSVIGAIGGAIAGNQIAKSRSNCASANAYGYYDTNGAWHANAVNQASAQGYYDRDGRWVDGAPNGYYDSQNRWIAANTNASASGYYDRNGRYVPASAGGYYDVNGQWVGASASGYYSNGRWIAGPATGRYDANGRWVAGSTPGRRASNGAWVADAQPGYYNSNGRWVAGQAYGYYDGQGRWVATAPSAGGYGQNASYQQGSVWAGAPMDIRGRQTWLQDRIQRGLNDGSLSRAEAAQANRSLSMISRQERGMRHYRNGQLGARDAATIQAKLDTVAATIRLDRRDRDDRPRGY